MKNSFKSTAAAFNSPSQKPTFLSKSMRHGILLSGKSRTERQKYNLDNNKLTNQELFSFNKLSRYTLKY